MTKKEVLDLWMDGDGVAIRNATGISKQLLHYWKTRPAAKSTYDAAILAFCKGHFKNRAKKKKLMSVVVELPTA